MARDFATGGSLMRHAEFTKVTWWGDTRPSFIWRFRLKNSMSRTLNNDDGSMSVTSRQTFRAFKCKWALLVSHVLKVIHGKDCLVVMLLNSHSTPGCARNRPHNLAIAQWLAETKVTTTFHSICSVILILTCHFNFLSARRSHPRLTCH